MPHTKHPWASYSSDRNPARSLAALELAPVDAVEQAATVIGLHHQLTVARNAALSAYDTIERAKSALVQAAADIHRLHGGRGDDDAWRWCTNELCEQHRRRIAAAVGVL